MYERDGSFVELESISVPTKAAECNDKVMNVDTRRGAECVIATSVGFAVWWLHAHLEFVLMFGGYLMLAWQRKDNERLQLCQLYSELLLRR